MITNRRLEFHEILCEILGSRYVYYQPPASLRMTYPAIVYSLSDIEPHHADNLMYRGTRQYQVVIITKDPDTEYIDKMLDLPMCEFSRSYTQDNLYHYIFYIYF